VLGKQKVMVDIKGVVTNSLWIVGLAILLAVLSWVHWLSKVKRTSFRDVVKHPQTQRYLNTGLFLFSIGLATSTQTWWERTLWGLLAAAWGVQVCLAQYRIHKSKTKDKNTIR
jgi:hypothetical protein